MTGNDFVGPAVGANSKQKMIINYQLDGGPFKFAGFVAHDSRLRFGSFNHAQGGNINLQRPPTALNSLPLSGA